jgi:hypothetical protein
MFTFGMENEILYRRAAARVEMQLAFYRHLMIYVVVNVFLAILNISRSPHHLWFQWVIFGWGIGVLSHGLNVYSYRWMRGSRERMIQREIERESRQPRG